MSDLMTEALSRIEGYAEKESDRDRARRLLADVRATGWKWTFESAAANAQAALACSGELDEIRAAIAAREAARADFEAFNEIESLMKDKAKAYQRDKIDAPTEDAVAPALEWLGTQMSALMSHVRTLDSGLGTVRSIEAAIRDDDLITLWRDLEDAADRYEQIRGAQEKICRMTATEEDGPALSALLNKAGRLRNAFDHDAYWIRTRTPGKATARDQYNGSFLGWREEPPARVYEWFEEDRGFEMWPFDAQSPLDSRATRHADRTDALRWLASNHAAWVPTFAQLRAAAFDMDMMMQRSATQLSLAETRAALEAFDRYYTQRGVTPVNPFDGKTALAALPKPRGLRDNRTADGRMHTDPRILALLGE
ncbi:hypothetical protein AB0N64_06265 [Microbacterium sp. NPDC089318]